MKQVNYTTEQQMVSEEFFNLKLTISLEGELAENQEPSAMSFAAKDLAYTIRQFVLQAFGDSVQ